MEIDLDKLNIQSYDLKDSWAEIAMKSISDKHKLSFALLDALHVMQRGIITGKTSEMELFVNQYMKHDQETCPDCQEAL